MLKYRKFLAAVGLLAALTSVGRVCAEDMGEFRQVIATIEAKDGSYSQKLYKPLRRMGLALHEAGDYEDAIAVFRKMQHLVHRNSGVYSPQQAESVQLIIDSYIRDGKVRNADTQHHFLYRVATRSFDEDDLNVHVARVRLADWYRRTGRVDDALMLYAESRRLLETARSDDEMLMSVLREEALTMYLSGRCCASDRLERAVRVAAEREIADRQDRLRLLHAYADMLILEKKHDVASEVYALAAGRPNLTSMPMFLGLRHPDRVNELFRQATMRHPESQVTSTGRRGSEIGSAWVRELPPTVGEPVPVCSAALSELSISREDLPDLYLDVEMEVDSKGKARDISVSGNAPRKLAHYVRTVLIHGRYRPFISDAGEVAEASLSFRQTFKPGPAQHRVEDDLVRWGAMMVSRACQVSMSRT